MSAAIKAAPKVSSYAASARGDPDGCDELVAGQRRRLAKQAPKGNTTRRVR